MFNSQNKKRQQQILKGVAIYIFVTMILFSLGSAVITAF
jgi:hypothetical protein